MKLTHFTSWEVEDDGGAWTLHLSLSLVVNVYPADKGCRYTANGDGWPATGPEVELLGVVLLGADIEIDKWQHELKDDDPRAWGDLRKLFETAYENDAKLRARIEADICQEAAEADEGAREAAAEARAEQRREDLLDIFRTH
jgi:hypothetical protein